MGSFLLWYLIEWLLARLFVVKRMPRGIATEVKETLGRRDGVGLSGRRREDLVIQERGRGTGFSGFQSALRRAYLTCHPFVVVRDERDASLAVIGFLIDYGRFAPTIGTLSFVE